MQRYLNGNYEHLVLMHTLLLKIPSPTKIEQKNPTTTPPSKKTQVEV